MTRKITRQNRHLGAGASLLTILMLQTPPAQSQTTGSIPLPGQPDTTSQSGWWTEGSVTKIELGGYIENTLTGEYVVEDDRNSVFNETRTRLYLSGKPNRHLDCTIGVIASLHSGTTTLDLVPYLPDETRQRVTQADSAGGGSILAAFFGYEMEDDLYVQEAFGTLHAGALHLRIGRHKFYTGTGYAFNPIDVFSIPAPLDPTYEIDGLDALLAEVDLPRQTQVQWMVRVSEQLKRKDYLARLKTHISGWDIALQYTYLVKDRVDWEMIYTDKAVSAAPMGMSTEPVSRRFQWHLAAAEFAGGIAGLGFYGEGGYVFIEEPSVLGSLSHAGKDHERFLFGIDHTFDSQLYVIAEYLRFGQGRTSRSEITLNDRMAFFTAEVISTNRDNLFSGLSYPITNLTEISLYAIVAMNDPSTIMNPWVWFDLYPGLKLTLTAYVPVGEEDSQIGNAGTSGFARVKLSF